MKQSWRQTQADAQLEVHFKLNVPERLTALQALNAAHRATDFTSLLSLEGGPVDLSWPLPLGPSLLACASVFHWMQGNGQLRRPRAVLP